MDLIIKHEFNPHNEDTSEMVTFEFREDGVLTIDGTMSVDFEFHHYYNTNEIKLIRGFQIYSPDLLAAQYEQALLNLLLRYHFFKLEYRDQLPCLTYTRKLA